MTVSIQETTIKPTKDGYAVELYISDKPRAVPEDADPELALILRVQIDRTGTATLAGTQLNALNLMLESLKPVMSALYPRG